jgi:hypothetical protein
MPGAAQPSAAASSNQIIFGRNRFRKQKTSPQVGRGPTRLDTIHEDELGEVTLLGIKNLQLEESESESNSEDGPIVE